MDAPFFSGMTDWRVNMLKCVLVAVAGLVTVAMQVGAGSAASAEQVMHGQIEPGEVQPVLLEAGTGDSPDVLRAVWMIWEREEEELVGRLRCTMLSHPQGKWRVDVTVATAEGLPLQTQSAVLENSGIIISVPMIGEGELTFRFGGNPAAQAGLYSVRLGLAGADEPAGSGLEGLQVSPEAEAVDASRWIDVIVQDSEGRPVATGFEVWRRVEVAPRAHELSVLNGPGVVWEKDGVAWEVVRSIGGSVREDYQPSGDVYRIADLEPGVYRLSAYTAARGWDRDPSPFTATAPIDLRNTAGTKVVMVLPRGYPLTLRVVEGDGHRPAGRTAVVLRLPNGLPISTSTDEDGVLRLTSVVKGDYEAEIGRRDWWSFLHPESITRVKLKVQSDRGTEFKIRHDQQDPVRERRDWDQ